MNLRSLLVGRRRSDKSKRNITGSSNDMETEEESANLPSLRLSSLRQRKCQPVVSIFNDINMQFLDLQDGNIIPSQYPVTGPILEEEFLVLDILLSAGKFDDDEDISEPEEDDMLLMQEVVLERIDFCI
ncbi:hypothetical protein CPB85DRAFT_1256856 [Mucidula mucida]|nr:hypothetical protein CPB85DRAFT_1256856 [Mucidula mucida]